MGWTKGRKRGPRKPKPVEAVEILPHDPTAPFGPEAYEAGHSDMAAAPSLPIRDQILLGLMEPPPHYRKAADYQLGKGPWEIIRCRECGQDTYSKDPRKHDVCENCLWTLMHQLADVEQARIVRNTDRVLNPFRSINPFNELGGSLPSIKRG